MTSRTWAGPTFEAPHVMTGPFTVGKVEKVLIALVPLPCARRLLSPLRERYVSYLQHTHVQPFEGKRYEKPDNVTTSMYVAMAALLAVK